MVLVWPRILPETTDTAPNSPIARALHRMTPYNNPHLMLGKVTYQKVCQPRAPRTTAASSSSRPWACISGISSRATKGKVTNTVASTMPGTAKMILMSCSTNHGPNQPLTPNTSTYIRPTMTGDTENGKSIRVVSRCLPRNSNLAIAQAAATPNTRFSGTEITAVSKVSLIAERASGSDKACQYTSAPLRKASTNTASKGSSRKKAKNDKASSKISRFTQADSRVAGLFSKRLAAGHKNPVFAGDVSTAYISDPAPCVWPSRLAVH